MLDPSSRQPLIALTMGDPAGIGPDTTLSAWMARESRDFGHFVVLGDPEVYRTRARLLGMDVPVTVVDAAADAGDVFVDALPVLPVPLSGPVSAGEREPGFAPAITGAIEKAVDLVLSGAADALTTNPINKKLLYESGFRHSGHTDFLGALAKRHGMSAHPVMMLACKEFRVVPATVHIPLDQVSQALTRELLAGVIRTTARALADQFGVAKPRLAVTGLNPHAGEEGTMGEEEIKTIVPVLDQLRAEGLDLSGPYPADTIFQPRLRPTYDAVVAMYHDQALIPVKTLAFDRAVNVTLGLPFIRTSPDHGTAYDLAGTGSADASSLIEALDLAALLASNRAKTEQ